MNVKKDFISWVINKKKYQGYNLETFVERFLDFIDFDPFELDDDLSNIESIKQHLKTELKGLKSKPQFVEFNSKSGSGIPSGLMGNENYIKYLNELKTNQLTPYFNLSGIKDYQKVSETSYNSSTKEANWYYDTRGKLYYLITLIGERLQEEFELVYHEKPNAQKGRGKILFKDYILAGFAPKTKNIGDHLFIKISFGDIKRKPHFSIDLDMNFSSGKSKFLKDRNKIYKESQTIWEIDDLFPDNWNELLKLILPKIKKLNEQFKKLTSNFSYSELNKKTFMNLNQILYGPPGTGKTYTTINKALSILESKSEEEINKEDRGVLKERCDDYLKKGQIVFTTFHQSMSYEDYIEGIKPHTKNEIVTYSIKDGIFKSLVKKALIEYIRKDSDTKETGGFDELYNDFVKSIKSLEGIRQSTFTTKTGVEIMLVAANDSSLFVKYLWTNKKKETEGQHTFSVTKEKLKKVLQEGIDPNKIKSLKAELHPLIGHIHCELFAVYKKFYDFVIDNKGEIETIHFDYEELSFTEIKEQFDLLSKEEINTKSVKPYIIIIDEINRGNVSQIFGELITLIEEDKRLGKDEALEVTLPYSKEKFGVPPNLFIIGTMNTADRSVEALDTALRRRFSFEEMPPRYDLEGLDKEVYGYPLKDILKTINKRIIRLLDNDHAIGHAYFLNKNEDTIIDSFNRNIIPLLQEYFFGDYGKMMLSLGDGFVTYDEWKDDEKFFASSLDAKNDYDVKDVYAIKNYTLENKQGFAEALKKLMNK